MKRTHPGRMTLGLAAAWALVALAACGGGGTASTGSVGPGSGCDPATGAGSAQCGSLLVAVTDAQGDFVSYTVDVLSLTLRRGNGGTVEALPTATRIDFAALSDLSEIVAAATLAPGDIVGGTLRLNYSDAEIFVEADGEIAAAEIVDENGAPLGIVDVEVRLADRDRLVITRARTAFLSVDFDLAVSHEVDTSRTPPLVTARPYIVAEVQPIDEKEIRLRGSLVDVDLDAASYDIRVRPWHRHDGDHGIVTVHTTPATSFEIGAAMSAGRAGLEALQALDAGTITVAFGTLDLAERRFTAEIVHARDSVGGLETDAVHGNVVARSGDRLVVKGALAVRRDRAAHFQRTVLVDLGPGTHVHKVGDDTALDKDAVSVGQRIVAFGRLQDSSVEVGSAAAPEAALVLDASEGRVRMLVTRLHGAVAQVTPGRVELRLRAIDRLAIDMFDFAGTGIDSASDADPNNYEVATAALPLAALEVDKWARVLGFVSPFGAAPPDFEGRTVVGHRDIPAVLGIGWGAAGTSAPFVQMSTESLVPDLTNPDLGERHHLLLGSRVLDLLELPGSPEIAPSPERSVYGIWQSGHVELFADFGAFVDQLAVRLGGADAARSLSASGRYDEAGDRLEARRVTVHMIGAD